MSMRIGFIGLGAMGRWMALNIMKAGYPLGVFDIDPEAVQLLTHQGAETANSPAELISRADCVFLSLPDTAEAWDGGPLASVRDGDVIEINVPGGSLQLLVTEKELVLRQRESTTRPEHPAAGVPEAYREMVNGADSDAVWH
jgi:hypothetical protein